MGENDPDDSNISDMFFDDPIAPVRGHILAHISHTRIYLRKSNGER